MGRFEDFRRVIEQKPDFAPAFYSLGNALRNKGDLDGAVASYSEAILKDPKDARAYVGRGDALLLKKNQEPGDLDAALKDFNEAIRLDPNNSGAYLSRVKARRYSAGSGDLIKDLSEVIRLDPRNADAYLMRGEVEGVWRRGHQGFQRGDQARSEKGRGLHRPGRGPDGEGGHGSSHEGFQRSASSWIPATPPPTSPGARP